MNIQGYISLTVGCMALLGSSHLFAQQPKTTEKPVETRVVEVTRDFKGEITDADRIGIQLRPVDSVAAFKSVFDYKINPISLPVFSTTKPLDAVMIEEKSKLERDYGYARLGLGVPRGLLGDLYLHYRFSSKTMVNLYYNHRSYLDKITMITDQPPGYNLPTKIIGNNSKNDLGLSFQQHFDALSLHVAVDYKNRYVIYHGHDTAYLSYLDRNYPDYINDIDKNPGRIKDMLGESYNIVNAQAGIASNRAADQLSYSAGAMVGYMHGKMYSVNEYIGNIYGKVSQPFNEVNAVQLGLQVMGYNKGGATHCSDVLFHLAPGYVYDHDKIKLSAGIDFEAVHASYSESPARDSGKTKLNVYPNLTFEGKPWKNFTGYVSIKGGTIINTYQKIALENPYMLPDLAVENTKKSISLLFGVRGNIFNVIGYNAFAEYANFDHLYYYVNSTQALPTTESYVADGYLRNNFDVQYHNTKQWTLGVDLDYKAGNFEALLHGRYYSYSIKDTVEAWHKPLWEMSADLSYRLNNFTFQVGLAGRGRAPYLYQNPTTGQETREIKASADLSAQVEYRINKWFTAFVYGGNLLNQKSQHYYLYYLPGINGGIGATVRF